MTVEVEPITVRDRAARAAEVAGFPNLPSERRFGVEQVGHGASGIHVAQTLPGTVGEVQTGWIGVLADFTTGRAVQSVLVPHVGIRTVGMHIDLGAAGLPAGERLCARGRVLDAGTESVLAAARCTDSAGRLVATVMNRFLVVPGSVEPTETDAAAPILAQSRSRSLAEMLDATVTVTGAGESRAHAPAAAWLTNPYGIVHGGIPVALADVVLVAAAESVAGPVRTLGLDLAFHRPALLGEDPLRATARVDRAGARVISVHASVFQRDAARPVLTATCTMLRRAG